MMNLIETREKEQNRYTREGKLTKNIKTYENNIKLRRKDCQRWYGWYWRVMALVEAIWSDFNETNAVQPCFVLNPIDLRECAEILKHGDDSHSFPMQWTFFAIPGRKIIKKERRGFPLNKLPSVDFKLFCHRVPVSRAPVPKYPSLLFFKTWWTAQRSWLIMYYTELWQAANASKSGPWWHISHAINDSMRNEMRQDETSHEPLNDERPPHLQSGFWSPVDQQIDRAKWIECSSADSRLKSWPVWRRRWKK